MSTAQDRTALLEILELYRTTYPYLWDRSNPMYSDKYMRSDAYKALLQIYRANIDTDASMNTLKKKLENMRNTYFKELRKVKESISSGDKEVYVPSLWYFEHLSFLDHLYDPSRRYFSKQNCSIASATDPLKTENMSLDTSDSVYEHDYEQLTPKENISNRTVYKRKQIQAAFNKQERQSLERDVTTKCEDWEVLGRSIGIQLRDLSKKQLTIASKLISDTLYFAKLNRLSEESYVDTGTVTMSTICSMCAGQVDD